MSSLALVTGASSGIGRESAIALAEAGHDVIVGYGHHRDAASETAETIRGLISHGSGALLRRSAPARLLAARIGVAGERYNAQHLSLVGR